MLAEAVGDAEAFADSLADAELEETVKLLLVEVSVAEALGSSVLVASVDDPQADKASARVAQAVAIFSVFI